MRTTAVAFLLSAFSLALPAVRAQQSCVVCHGAEGLALGRSVHARVGITCTACHGGIDGVLDVTAHGEDLRTLADPLEAVETCGGCHADQERMRVYGRRTDQLALFWTSRHGAGLRENGDLNVATCVSCHGAHDILAASDPRSPSHPLHVAETCGRCHADAELMAQYGIDTGVDRAYRDSVHGRALLEGGHLSSPSCADCHGAHGATPPRVAEVAEVCGECHTVVRDYFEQSPHRTAAAAGKMQECTSCHGHHHVTQPTLEMFASSTEGHCGACHEEGDAGMQVAQTISAGLRAFDEEIASTEERLVKAALRGLFIESEHGYLDEARALRVRTAPLTHALAAADLGDLLNRGNAMIQQTLESLEVKERALRDRKIFTGIFFAIVLVLAGGLLRYRRGIAQGWKGSSDASRVWPSGRGN